MGLFRRRREPSTVDVIDLREPSAPKLTWGLPSPCPECGSPGYLDRIDIRHEVMDQHCPNCLHRWQLARADIEAASPG